MSEPREPATGTAAEPLPPAAVAPQTTAVRDGADAWRAQPGALYVVATPIGNLGDFAPRAQAVLAGVDRIAAEDTRTSAVLLGHFGIRTPLVALHEHNEARVTTSLLRELREGRSLALISDAGTPLISDPGYTLLRDARAASVPVYALPGPCAAIAALSVSGLATDCFVFVGFLPAKAAARRTALHALLTETRTAIVYESTHRIADSLADLVAVLGDTRRVCLARELSKRFEESVTLPAAELLAWLHADANRDRGEFVLVIEGAPSASDEAEGERVLRLLLNELPPSRAARLAHAITGAARKPLYARALELTAGKVPAPRENDDNSGDS